MKDEIKKGMQAVLTFLQSKVQPELVPYDSVEKYGVQQEDYESVVNYIFEDFLNVTTRSNPF